MAAQAVHTLLVLVSTAVLARLLTPADFGLVALAGLLHGLLNLVRDAGLSEASVQARRLGHEQASNLFWASVAFSLLLCLAAVALAPGLATLYGEPRLVVIAIALSLGLLAGGLGSQHEALLRRALRFQALSAIRLVASIMGTLCGVVVAWQTHSFWALVAIPVATAWLQTGLLWLTCPWKPGRARCGVGSRALLRFGADVTGFNLVNFLRRSADNALLGYFAGPAVLGLYSKAYQLLLLPIQQVNRPVTQVVLPALARLRDDPALYLACYRSALTCTTAVAMPVVAFLAIDVERVVALLLGDQWTGVVPIFRILALAAFVDTFNVATGWVYLSLGHTARQLRWAFAQSAVFLVAFAIGVHWGAEGVAAAYVVALALVRVPALLVCFAGTPLRLADVSSAIWRPALAATLAAAGPVAVQHWPSPILPVLQLSLDLVAYFVVYLAAWALLPGGAGAMRFLGETLFEREPGPVQ